MFPSARVPGVPADRRVAVALVGLAALLGLARPAAADGPAAATALAPRPGVYASASGSFDAALRDRLESEARRHRLAAFLPAAGEPWDADDAVAEERGRRARRVLVRALRGTLDDRLEDAARGSTALRPLFRWIDAHDEGPPEPPSSALAPGVVPAPSGGAPADLAFRFRLDAHPRLVLGGRLGALRGRIEVPLLEREVRLALEHPIGGHGRASIRGGRSEERGGWGDVALRFRF